MKLRYLRIKDKKIFNKFLSLKKHELSYYNFCNIFIWQGLFKIYWQIIDKNLCIFFQDRAGYFMYLPPLGKNVKDDTLKKCFQIMNKLSNNKEICRIENIEEKQIDFYRNLNYRIFPKDKEYVCNSIDLTQLKGDRFKAKRAGYNFFIKNYKYEFSEYQNSMQEKIRLLHKLWQDNRREKYSDHIYQGLLEDSKSYLEVALKHFKQLDLKGYIVKINKQIKGFTSGFRINKKMFCVLFEITDPGIKGINSFIFKEFTQKLKKFPEINIMDDSGLINLQKTKLSWRPYREISSYVATKNQTAI